MVHKSDTSAAMICAPSCECGETLGLPLAVRSGGGMQTLDNHQSMTCRPQLLPKEPNDCVSEVMPWLGHS